MNTVEEVDIIIRWFECRANYIASYMALSNKTVVYVATRSLFYGNYIMKEK